VGQIGNLRRIVNPPAALGRARRDAENRQHLLRLCRYVLLSVIFFARRDEFLSSRLVEERDAGAVHGEDGGDCESAL
jgi:hypothetical protein